MADTAGGHAPVYWPIRELRTAFAKRRLSPVELLEDVLERIEQANPALHAYLHVCEELAREQAAAAEADYRSGQAAPLAGIPISIKDTFHISGEPTTFGSLCFKDYRSDHDSGVVRRLRAAGAVFVGKTNTSEFGQSATTENRFADDCHNPWSLTRTAGGSSGGAAASVAAGLATVGIGADGGGSIRIPASFTGMFGIKPSYRVCPDEDGFSAMRDFVTPGPIARHVADAREVFEVLRMGDGRQVGAAERLRVGWCARPDGKPHTPEVIEVVRAAVAELTALGHRVTEIELELDGWQAAFGPLVLINEREERGMLLESAADQLTDYEVKSLQAAAEVTPDQVAQAQRDHSAYRRRVAALFDRYDLLVMPTTAVPAFPIGERPKTIDGQEVGWLWGAFPSTAPFNVAGTPAVSVPCGFVSGLPVGMQMVAVHGHDDLLLSVAEHLEARLAVDRFPGAVALQKEKTSGDVS